MNIKNLMNQQIGALKEMQTAIVENGKVLSDADKKELEEYVDKQRRICENMKKVADVKLKENKPKEENKTVTTIKKENKEVATKEPIEDDFDDILG